MLNFPLNKKYPLPTDRFIRPFYKDYNKFKMKIASQWVKGIKNDLLKMRDFSDLKDVRLHVVQDSDGATTPIIRLKPTISDEDRKIIGDYEILFFHYNIAVLNIIDTLRARHQKNISGGTHDVWLALTYIESLIRGFDPGHMNWSSWNSVLSQLEHNDRSIANQNIYHAFHKWVRNNYDR